MNGYTVLAIKDFPDAPNVFASCIVGIYDDLDAAIAAAKEKRTALNGKFGFIIYNPGGIKVYALDRINPQPS